MRRRRLRPSQPGRFRSRSRRSADGLLDPRDPDEDGRITLADVATCAERCTRPHCLPAGGVRWACGLLGTEALIPLAWGVRRRKRSSR